MDKDSSLVKAAKKQDEPFIVGIGASAGGLEALQNLLTALPADLGFSYVLIQHLSPDYKSLLSEILSKNTSMPVIQAEDHMAINPDCVYVIPPRKTLYISDGSLCLDEQKSGELHLPIDTFFRSLAENVGANAIAVVLSGTGSDGTNGIKSIKENDGMVIVQSPENSKFDGMPKSAVRTGLVDFLGTPEEIALELEHVSLAAKGGNLHDKTEREIDDELMGRIYYALRKASDINFTHYKRATLLRRVERRMLLARKETLADYVDYLGERPDEAKILAKEVLIGVTNFFREPEFFECLKEKAVTNIVANSKEEEPIRVWVAGCSTGEEAYSIAILFCEVMETLKLRREVKIFATDLDAEAVATAGKGVYGTSIASSVSTARLSRYFSRKGNNYTINRDVRKMLIFSPHNVIQDPPFARLDLISCRNLMIYFQPVLQKDLFSIFHAALKDGGYLFLGKSEAVGTYTEVFPVVDAMAKIFTHHSKVKIPGAKAVPYLQNMIDDEAYMDPEPPSAGGRDGAGQENISDQMAINTELLERFMPACLVVNEKNELVYVYGNSKNYISFPVGRVTSALFDIIEESLRIPVSTALKEAREKQKMVQYTGIHFSGDMYAGVLNLTALPISRPKEEADRLYALVFAEVKQSEAIPESTPYDINHMAAQRITDLEQELTKVHDRLTRSVTEQECVNEELQASNEELLTANEELQSSNEELQSVNEELYTVNSEYQLKLTELAEMSDDITNFLATTLIGIIFVDSKLNLRRFTNYVATEFNVLDQDIGRPIDFISYHFPELNISDLCHTVIETLAAEEREVLTRRGKTFFMRIVPFRTTDNKILGSVITFVDITAQKQGQLKLRDAEAQLSLAQQANEAKSDFLSRMSQQMRTPMDAIAGLAELMQTQLDDKAAIASSAQQIAETVKYMASLMSGILAISKPEEMEEGKAQEENDGI
ncbi:MAG: chemotaxis protein CheB [Clostridia bacterium]|nr:chemotaxis protein CheB [Clostridia bacterium]